MNYPINDPYFRVEVLSKTERPNLLSYLAMHQDYNESNVADELEKWAKLSDQELGERIVRNCIKYHHWGVLEHASISFNVIGFPHNVISQARTHRIGNSFDVQSMRYTGNRLVNVANDISSSIDYDSEGMPYAVGFDPYFNEDDIDKVIYLRPVGFYYDREGNKYEYTQKHRNEDLNLSYLTIKHYANRINQGFAPEHARGCLVYDFRQDFVVTFNARSLLHFCDLRLPMDAQPEIRTLAQMLFEKFEEWMPETAEFYKKSRYQKNKLAP